VIVSEACLGVMTLGGDQCDTNVSFAVLDHAWDAGIDFFDTAELYPVSPRRDHQGRSTALVGEWLRSRGDVRSVGGVPARDAMVVASKVSGPAGPSPASLSWIPSHRQRDRARWNPEGEGWTPLTEEEETSPVLDPASVRAALEAELSRLGRTHIDLWQLHWPQRYLANFGRAKYDWRVSVIRLTLLPLPPRPPPPHLHQPPPRFHPPSLPTPTHRARLPDDDTVHQIAFYPTRDKTLSRIPPRACGTTPR